MLSCLMTVYYLYVDFGSDEPRIVQGSGENILAENNPCPVRKSLESAMRQDHPEVYMKSL
jgi:hypothetical protein